MTPGSLTPRHRSLVDLLRDRARHDGHATAFRFDDRAIRFTELWDGARRAAGRLLAAGAAPGRPTVLVLPNGPDFFLALYGTLLAGAVPMPVAEGSGPDRVRELATRYRAAAAVVGAAWPSGAEVAPARLVRADTLTAGPPLPRPQGEPEPDDLALVQITSGSTGEPKAVCLSHGALLTNVEQMIAGMELSARDVFVSWLPTSHDMGLILKTLAPFRLGAELVLLPTRLRSIHTWLAAIQSARGTFVAAPDFAWRLCLRAVRRAAAVDLSSLRVALNAAEMVRPATLEGFARTFGLPRVMVPGYGLAEATVGVSMQPPGTEPAVDDRGFVSIGRPFPGVELTVLDGAAEAPPGEVGELAVASPALTTGYLDDPTATAELFWKPGWIRTGDLAWQRTDGEVFVVGRAKDLIIQAGTTVAPVEMEAAAEAVAPVRRAAAVAVDRGGLQGEQAWLVAELRRATAPPADACDEIVVAVAEAIGGRLGLRPARILLVRPRSIPLTDTGKIRRRELARRIVDGRLGGSGAVLHGVAPRGDGATR